MRSPLLCSALCSQLFVAVAVAVAGMIFVTSATVAAMVNTVQSSHRRARHLSAFDFNFYFLVAAVGILSNAL